MYRRECEMKFFIENKEKENNLRKKIELKAENKISCIETDFTPDTEDDLCKINKIILRFRNTVGDVNRSLITLKHTYHNIQFQDFLEIEYCSDTVIKKNYYEINRVLKKCTNFHIEENIVFLTELSNVVKSLADSGFSKCRMFSQKERDEYTIGDQKICIDKFPENIGTYIEIETVNPEDLYRLQLFLELDEQNKINKNYGKLIQDKQAHKEGVDRRISTFDEKLNISIKEYLKGPVS